MFFPTLLRTAALAAVFTVATQVAHAQTTPAANSRPVHAESHEETTKNKTTVKRRYSTAQPRPVQYICPEQSEAFAASGTCPEHKRTLIKEGTYYCTNHTAKQAMDPGKCSKCKEKLVAAWPAQNPYTPPADSATAN